MSTDEPRSFGVVAIGRNEGERLKRCLESVSNAAQIIYVDSGSTDGSLQWARLTGVDSLALDLSLPFTAARARNVGFRRLRTIAPDLKFIQFIDGDCELNRDWPDTALSFLGSHEHVCAVLGRRRERYPERSVYNLMCDQEWNVPLGEVKACGGDVMMRIDALEAAGGYRDDLIAGEEPELCVRLRAAGWKIWRLDQEMTLHDASLVRFSQWWRRQMRSGYAFVQGAQLHGRSPDRHWVWESRRALIWGLGFPLVLISATFVSGWWGALLSLVYPLQILRRMPAMHGAWRTRFNLAFFEQLSRFAEMMGELRFFRDQYLGRHRKLIEYK